MDDISTTTESIARPADRSAGSEASRYFAAAAYRDRAFRRKVLAFLDHGWYRARAPEFGIDERFVATHCRQAARRETMRNLLMLLAFCIIGFAPLLTLATEAEEVDDIGLILAYYKVELVCAVLAAALVLFVERLITPLQPAFYKIDEMDPRLRADALFGLIMQSIVTAPFMLVIGVFDVLGAVFRPFSRLSERGRIRQSMERNPRFNFGAVTSIREMGMQNYYRVYFQQLDKERHVKTIEQCTIDAIVDFLSDHNIDTSDIRDRRTAILNNGVIVSGGDLNAENLAVGKGAKAAVSRLGGKPRNNGPSAGAAP